MWVVAATVGVGLVTSVMSSRAQSKAADKAAKAQTAAAKSAEATQLYMYDTSRRDFAPFMQPSARAMATYEAGIYGKPVQYNDPSYEFDKETSMYIGPDGQEVEAPPKLTATYAPTESAGFRYVKDRTMSDLGRQLRMLGRGNSTFGANTMGRTLSELNLGNEAQYKNDLFNLIKAGQGAAGTIGGLGSNTANNVSNINMTAGDNAANAALAQGKIKADLYQSFGNFAQNAIGGGYNAFLRR